MVEYPCRIWGKGKHEGKMNDLSIELAFVFYFYFIFFFIFTSLSFWKPKERIEKNYEEFLKRIVFAPRFHRDAAVVRHEIENFQGIQKFIHARMKV